MTSIEVGRICVKLSGRDAGKKCVIVDVIDKNFVLITGPKSVTGIRRRRTNVDHLEPTSESVEVKKSAADDEVEKALSKSKKSNYMKESASANLAAG
jgi:large subunit ribosomal protein L14e